MHAKLCCQSPHNKFMDINEIVRFNTKLKLIAQKENDVYKSKKYIYRQYSFITQINKLHMQ